MTTALDHNSYRRAANAALIGGLVQLLLSIIVAVAGLAAKSPALYMQSWHLLGGLPIWIVLWMLYNQHRLERIEALETEQLSKSDAQTAALFDEHAVDLQIAKKRLENLYNWGLPTVGVIVAVYLIAVGVTGLVLGYNSYTGGVKQFFEDAKIEAVNPVVFLVVSLVVAFISFVIARYQAGMTRVPAWQLLRGGASYLMGVFFLAILSFVAFAFSAIGTNVPYNDAILAYFGLLYPALFVLQGLEILLNFLLNVYRPRRPGEIPRAAFDSRILGLLTSPESLAKALGDAINYQFGFEVSRSWFYQLLGDLIVPLFVGGVAVLFLISSLVIVAPQEKGVIITFGAINSASIVEPGPHLKLPWPFATVDKYAVGRVHQITVGSAKKLKTDVALLWTTSHSEDKEDYLITASSQLHMGPSESVETPNAGSAAADTKVPGNSMIGAQIVVQYRVSDLETYIKTAEQAEQLLTDMAEQEVNSYFVTKDIDVLLGAGRIDASVVLRDAIAKRANEAKLGFEVISVSLSALHPPTDDSVADAFQEQIGAIQERQTTIEKAKREAIETLATVAGTREKALEISAAIKDFESEQHGLEQLKATSPDQVDKIKDQTAALKVKEQNLVTLLTSARGQAAQIIYEAQSYRWNRSQTERGKAERFVAELEAYKKSPQLFRTRRYLEVLAEGMDTSRKVVVATKQTVPGTYRIDLKDSADVVGGFMKSSP